MPYENLDRALTAADASLQKVWDTLLGDTTPKQLRGQLGALVDDLQALVGVTHNPHDLKGLLGKLAPMNKALLKYIPRYQRWQLNRIYVFIVISLETMVKTYGVKLSGIKRAYKESEKVLNKSHELLKGWVPPSCLRHQVEQT